MQLTPYYKCYEMLHSAKRTSSPPTRATRAAATRCPASHAVEPAPDAHSPTPAPHPRESVASSLIRVHPRSSAVPTSATPNAK
jgi:hypothetical protein